ncbi:uncharacterized protein LOC111358052 [Spodoptera litura]|uniref:Uncharacterized protein LOC111358052 n=1 Tax=Spodoptera litura TaxID=69820 RepID=A0A9J7IXK9_SPOLT|nr:uncharacterized protein LOC111358052 [Spodoptera litura]
MPSCVVKFCRNNSTHQTKSLGVTFHRFPPETDWKEKWIKALRDNRKEEEWTPSKFSVVCSLHFLECDTYMTKGGYRKIKKDAAPKKMFLKDSEWFDKIEPPIVHVCDQHDTHEEEKSKKEQEPQNGQDLQTDPLMPDLDIEEIDLISAEWCQEMEELGITTESLAALLDECYSDIENEFDDIDTEQPNAVDDQNINKGSSDTVVHKKCDCSKKQKKLRKKRTLQELKERFKVSYKIRVKKSKLQLLREKLTALKRTMRR